MTLTDPLVAPAAADADAPIAFAGTTEGANEGVLLRTAAQLTRDLGRHDPRIYWADFGVSAALGYAATALAVVTPPGWLFAAAVTIAILALYRAGSFIHELTHMKPNAVPGFHTGWNLLMGVPMLVPSFMYEGVHSLHHARTRYGTAEDPEYLPLALMPPATLALFVVVAVLAPVALLLRYGVLAPLSLVIPPLRRALVERYSALSINPSFRRRAPQGDFRAYWQRWEVAASLWAMAVLAGVTTGIIPWPAFLIVVGVMSGSTLLNQIRTLVAHLWANDGRVLTVTEQYLDSVNVPPPALLPALWAPVGLRYHALHHLLPGVPYHAMGAAHRRLVAAFPAGSAYHAASYTGLSPLVARLVAGSRTAHG